MFSKCNQANDQISRLTLPANNNIYQTQPEHSCLLTDANTKRETGKVAQLGNIAAAKVSNILLHYIFYQSELFSKSSQ
jgi:hypothetical protein